MQRLVRGIVYALTSILGIVVFLSPFMTTLSGTLSGDSISSSSYNTSSPVFLALLGVLLESMKWLDVQSSSEE